MVGCIDFALATLHTYGFEQFQVELSTWDPNDRKTYAGRDDQWELAQRSLEQALKRRNIEYKLIPGEAAFYGPKIDIKLVDAIGRLWQLSTCLLYTSGTVPRPLLQSMRSDANP